MAKELKNEAEMSVADKLQNLYKLQTKLTDIDKIKTLRGELPLEVQDLEDEIEGLNARITKIQADISESKAQIQENKRKIDTATAAISRYEEQMNNVSNNREYDSLNKERDYQDIERQLAEKKNNEAKEKIEADKQAVADCQSQIEELQKTLDEKKSELDGIIAETRVQEDKLRDEARELEESIEPRLLTAFKRIRKNSRNGLGIVYVERGACGGCFNKIPPQRQLDIRMRKKIIVCEYCGRILIDPELAGVKPEESEAPEKPKRRTRKKTATAKDEAAEK